MTKWVVAISIFMFIGIYDMPERPSFIDVFWKGIFSGLFGAALVTIGVFYEYFKRRKQINALKEKEMADKYFNNFNNTEHKVSADQVAEYLDWRKKQENNN